MAVVGAPNSSLTESVAAPGVVVDSSTGTVDGCRGGGTGERSKGSAAINSAWVNPIFTSEVFRPERGFSGIVGPTPGGASETILSLSGKIFADADGTTAIGVAEVVGFLAGIAGDVGTWYVCNNPVLSSGDRITGFTSSRGCTTC